VYSMVQRREKEKDSRYIQEASAPAAVTVYQTCNIMYICNKPVTLDASLTCLTSLSRGPKARICIISHMRARMLYLT